MQEQSYTMISRFGESRSAPRVAEVGAFGTNWRVCRSALVVISFITTDVLTINRLRRMTGETRFVVLVSKNLDILTPCYLPVIKLNIKWGILYG